MPLNITGAWRPVDVLGYQVKGLHFKLLMEAAERLRVSVTAMGQDVYRYERGGRVSYTVGRRLPMVSVVAGRVARDKWLTKDALQAAGLRTGRGAAFQSDQREEALRHFARMEVPAVVKPAGGAGGRAVWVNIISPDDFAAAWDQAVAADEGEVLVEEYIPGAECRVFVIGGEARAAAIRHPAHVVGDGVSTVAELVAIKSKARKDIPYVGEKSLRLTPQMLRLLELAGRGPEWAPEKGEYWQLHPLSNISSGGESEDVSERLHPGFAEIAVRACRAIPGLGYAGVDLISQDVTADPDGQRWAICEVNANPEFALHHYPVHGTPRDIAGALLDSLFR